MPTGALHARLLKALDARQQAVRHALFDAGGNAGAMLRPLRPPTTALAPAVLQAWLERCTVQIWAITRMAEAVPKLVEQRDWPRVLLACMRALNWALPLLADTHAITVRLTFR